MEPVGGEPQTRVSDYFDFLTPQPGGHCWLYIQPDAMAHLFQAKAKAKARATTAAAVADHLCTASKRRRL